jgi:ABC-type multidrug transport system fused ATPase/permease subunit
MLFDEATSALDNKSEAIVQESMDKVMKNVTCIVIAHRLSPIRNVHKILVFTKGEKVESGSHEDLMMLNGLYRSLVEAQNLNVSKDQETQTGDNVEKDSAQATQIASTDKLRRAK